MKLLLGNNIDLLKSLSDNSVDSVVTDPPYGLCFMNKKWDYDVPSVELWKEVYRVLKHGGHVLSFGGTRTYHRMVVNIEDAGFEIRDQIMWLYGSGFPKSHNIGKAIDAIEKTGKSNPKALREARMGDEYEPTGQIDYAKGRMFSSEIKNDNTQINITNDWQGWGTALKPANEPICLARKPLLEKSVAENVLKHGTGGINIDNCRIAHKEPLKETNIIGRNDSQVFSDNSCGFDNTKNTLASASTEGRFPANVMHDGSQEVVECFPDNSNRFFYCAKTSKKDREDLNNHPTVKPTDLMRYLCRLITPPNGIVLDPFMGSGSTGKGAILEGFDFIGMELENQYFEIAKSRISNAQKEYQEQNLQIKLL